MNVEEIRFTKMHGCGNDFILIDEHEGEVVSESRKGEFSMVACRRRFGIGADGVIFVCKSRDSEHDARMRIFNADGSEAEMSGNGMRCFAKYVYERGLVNSRRMKIETLGGIIIPEVECINDKVTTIRVFMGKPRFERLDAPLYVNEQIGELKLTAINLGNPHAVILVPSFDTFDLEFVGRSVESHPSFPDRTNVDFVVLHPDSENEISVRTYERGVGETLSCGTGSTASVLTLNELGLINADAPVTVHTPGGDLRVELKDEGAYLVGPAEEVFEGVFVYK